MILEDDIKALFQIIEEETNVKKEQFLAKNRTRHIVDVKRMVSACLMKHTQFTLYKIGDILGGLNHATIIHYRRTHANLLDSNKDYRKIYVAIDSQFEFLRLGGIPVEKKLEFAIDKRNSINKEINRLKKLIKIKNS